MPVIRRKLADAAPKPSATPKTRPIVVIAKPKQQPVVGAWKPDGSQRLLSVKEAAKYLGSSPWHIRRAFREGDFPRIRWGRRDMVDRADLDAWIEKMKAA